MNFLGDSDNFTFHSHVQELSNTEEICSVMGQSIKLLVRYSEISKLCNYMACYEIILNAWNWQLFELVLAVKVQI